jgi:hypothetical protein
LENTPGTLQILSKVSNPAQSKNGSNPKLHSKENLIKETRKRKTLWKYENFI